MARLVPEEEIEKVLEYIKTHLPESVIVYEVICRILEGYNPGYRVWASDDVGEPGFNVIVVSVDTEKCQNPYYRQLVHLFCTDPSRITDTLLSPGVVNFDEKVRFFGISECDMGYIASMEVWQDYNIVYDFVAISYWCFDEKKISICSLPDGFKQGKITDNDVDVVINTSWESDIQGSEKALQDLIQKNFPSVCLYNKAGRPIAWARKKYWGDMGSIYVTDPYRGRGMGKYITTTLARIILQEDGKVYARIGTDNVVSKKLHEAIGFTKGEKFLFRWYSPK